MKLTELFNKCEFVITGEVGAEFFQTQAVYDVKVFERFIKKAEKLGRPIQAGVVFLKSPA